MLNKAGLRALVEQEGLLQVTALSSSTILGILTIKDGQLSFVLNPGVVLNQPELPNKTGLSTLHEEGACGT